jgi:hypothetical protein
MIGRLDLRVIRGLHCIGDEQKTGAARLYVLAEGSKGGSPVFDTRIDFFGPETPC